MRKNNVTDLTKTQLLVGLAHIGVRMLESGNQFVTDDNLFVPDVIMKCVHIISELYNPEDENE